MIEKIRVLADYYKVKVEDIEVFMEMIYSVYDCTFMQLLTAIYDYEYVMSEMLKAGLDGMFAFGIIIILAGYMSDEVFWESIEVSPHGYYFQFIANDIVVSFGENDASMSLKMMWINDKDSYNEYEINNDELDIPHTLEDYEKWYLEKGINYLAKYYRLVTLP